MRFLLGLAVVAWALFTIWRPVEAAMDPASLTLEIDPGQTVQQAIGVTNDTPAAQVYDLGIVGVEFGQSAEDLRFIELDARYRSMLTLNASQLNVAGESRGDFSFTLEAPEAATSEEFAMAVIAKTQGREAQGIDVASAYATVVFVRINGGLEPTLQIKAFETVPGHDRSLPIRFAGLVTNTGEGLSQPEVGVIIRNPWGREIDHVSFNDLGRRVPAQTSRVFSGEWQGHPWRLGPYTADFYVYPDDSDTVLTASLRVVLFPWQMLVVFVLIATLFSGGIYVWRRALRR